MATLGWLKIGIATDTSQFIHGLKGAKSQLSSFAVALAPIKQRLAAFGRLIGNRPTEIFDPRTGKKLGEIKGWLSEIGGLMTGTVGKVAALGAAFGVAFGGKAIADWVRSSMEAITQIKTLGERVGLTSEALGKLQYAAKLSHLDGEELTNSLEKMNHKLGEVAVTGEGPAADALRRFGLSAQQLIAMGTEKAFYTLLDVLGKIPTPAGRAAVAMDLFGKGGQPIINMALKGTDAIKAMGDEALKTGAALNSVDAEKVAEADTAMVQIGLSIQGIGNQIAVQLAPFITDVANRMMDWMTSGTTAGDRMAQALDWVTAAFGGIYDAIQVISAGWHFMQSAFDNALSYILAGIDKLIKGFAWLYEKVRGIKLEISTMAEDMSKGLHDAALDELKKGMQPGKWGHQIAREFVDNLRQEAKTRATSKATVAEKNLGIGGAVQPKIVETQFGGALQAGSKEAYSAALKSRAMLENSVQNRIDINTRTTAEATTRTAVVLGQMLGDVFTKTGEQGREMLAAPG